MKLLVVILCSLIANVSTATAELDNDLNDKCHNTFKCYIPRMCDSRFTGDNFTISTVKELTIDDQIVKNCVAVVRFYGYNKKWVRVVMESRDTARTPPVSKIILHNANQPLFSCEVEEGKLTALYSESDAAVKINEKESSLQAPLKCVFDVQLKGAEDKFPEFQDAPVELEVNSDSNDTNNITQSANLKLNFGDHCDPQQLKYSRDHPDQRKEYSKVEYSVGKLSCKEGFEPEYLANGATAFEPVALTCPLTTFKANKTVLPKNEDIVIRCAGDARYSCLYKPKTGSNVIYVESKRADSIAGGITCPTGQFMFVRGKYSPGKIECLNREFSMRWVHKPYNGNETTILHKTSPLVECRTELDCSTMNPIKRSQVTMGQLINHVPQCVKESGELLLNGDKLEKVTCNGRTGHYMATLQKGGEPILVDSSTRFVCNYTDRGKEKNEKNVKKFLYIIIALIIAFVLFAIVAIVVTRVTWLKNKKKTQQLQKDMRDNPNANLIGEEGKGDPKEASKKKKAQKEPATRRKYVEKAYGRRLPQTFPSLECASYIKMTESVNAQAVKMYKPNRTPYGKKERTEMEACIEEKFLRGYCSSYLLEKEAAELAADLMK